MKHFVFLVGSYYPEVNASNICIKNVMDVLVKQGHRCKCVCFTKGKSRNDEVDGVPVYRVNDTSYLDIDTRGSKIKDLYKKTVHLLHSIIALPLFPETRPNESKKLLRLLRSVCEREKIDAIVPVYNPYTTIGAAIRYQELHPDIPIVGFFLDLIIDTTKPSLFPGRFFPSLCQKKEIETFLKMDYILVPEGKKNIYNGSSLYAQFNKRLYFFNFPTLVENPIGKTTSPVNNRFLFAGTTHSDYRNPMYAIKLLMSLAEHIKDIRFDMYGPTNIERQLRQMQEESNGFFCYHGKVAKEVINTATIKSRFMVSIGNNVPGMVASKTFEMFTYCRPIVHFTLGEEVDTSLPYIRKYPDVCIVDCNDSVEKSSCILEKFIHDERKKIDYQMLKEIYYSATPDALVDTLLNMKKN